MSVVHIDSARRRVWMLLFCNFCHVFRYGFWRKGSREYIDCPYCDEIATRPEEKRYA